VHQLSVKLQQDKVERTSPLVTLTEADYKQQINDINKIQETTKSSLSQAESDLRATEVEMTELKKQLEAAAGAESGVVRTAVTWNAAGSGPVKTFEPLAPDAPRGEPATLTEDGRFVVERIVTAPRVFVFGAGHVGAAIGRAAAAAGFRVVMIDDRAEYADPARFENGVGVLVGDADAALAHYTLSAADAVVIATRGHRNDALILERVATSPAGYVGLLGSRRKKAVVTKGLTTAGVPAKALKRVRVPVGLAIGAVTPEEIAVSVVAELIAWRRQ